MAKNDREGFINLNIKEGDEEYLTGDADISTSLKNLYNELCKARENRGWEVGVENLKEGEINPFESTSSNDAFDDIEDCTAKMSWILRNVYYKHSEGQAPRYSKPFPSLGVVTGSEIIADLYNQVKLVINDITPSTSSSIDMIGCYIGCIQDCKDDCSGVGCTAGCSQDCGKDCDTDCNSECRDSCKSNCSISTCTSGCYKNSCQAECQAICDSNNCSKSCSATCAGSTCTAACETACTSAYCTGSCSDYCYNECSTGSCYTGCSFGCNEDCTDGCTGSCENTCYFSCEGDCVIECSTAAEQSVSPV